MVGLAANSQIDVLLEQVKEFKPKFVFLADKESAKVLEKKVPKSVEVLVDNDGIDSLCSQKIVDHILIAISGAAALYPLLCAIKNKKEISLANKESLVMAGSLVMKQAREKKVKILPIDSEQSAIWQCLETENSNAVNNIYLTASGGPFRNLEFGKFKNITAASALKHPRWKMGKKITIDSATLMNKGLEVIEAMHLFAVDIKKIKVLIHPESIIHSMVEFCDGAIKAQLSQTDMRIPIQYALSYPQRLAVNYGFVDFVKLKSLNFFEPDFNKFPCLRLAFEAALAGGTLPAVMNAANEICVEHFLNQKIGFRDIPKFVEKVMLEHKNINCPNVKDIFVMDKWSRTRTNEIIGR